MSCQRSSVSFPQLCTSLTLAWRRFENCLAFEELFFSQNASSTFSSDQKFFSFQDFVHRGIAASWAEVDVAGDAFFGQHSCSDVDDVVVVGGGPMVVE